MGLATDPLPPRFASGAEPLPFRRLLESNAIVMKLNKKVRQGRGMSWKLTQSCGHFGLFSHCTIYDALYKFQKRRGQRNDPYSTVGHVITITIPRFVRVGCVDSYVSDRRDFRRLQRVLTMYVLPLLAFLSFSDRCCSRPPARSVKHWKSNW